MQCGGWCGQNCENIANQYGQLRLVWKIVILDVCLKVAYAYYMQAYAHMRDVYASLRRVEFLEHVTQAYAYKRDAYASKGYTYTHLIRFGLSFEFENVQSLISDSLYKVSFDSLRQYCYWDRKFRILVSTKQGVQNTHKKQKNVWISQNNARNTILYVCKLLSLSERILSHENLGNFLNQTGEEYTT